VKSRDQPIGQRARRALEGLGHVLHGLVRHDDVGLRGVVAPDDELPFSAVETRAGRLPDPAPGPVERRGSREAGRLAVRIHHADLPILERAVVARQGSKHVAGRCAGRHELESAQHTGVVCDIVARLAVDHSGRPEAWLDEPVCS
jgi:hypothetical protein